MQITDVKFPPDNHFDTYQHLASGTAIYPGRGWYASPDADSQLEQLLPLLYLGLKISGEAGEVSEKIGKALRDGIPEGHEKEWAEGLRKELGDVLWYVSQIAKELGWTLSSVASTNLDKLADRSMRGTLQGSGDDR